FHVIGILEEPYGAVLLTVNRSSNKHYVVQALKGNRPFDVQIGPGSLGQLAFQTCIYGNRSIDGRRVDTYDFAGDYSIASINRCFLADCNVLSLGLGDFQLRFKFFRVCDPGQIETWRYMLAYFYCNYCQLAVHPGFYVQGFDLALPEVVKLTGLIHPCLLNVQLGLNGFFRDL